MKTILFTLLLLLSISSFADETRDTVTKLLSSTFGASVQAAVLNEPGIKVRKKRHNSIALCNSIEISAMLVSKLKENNKVDAQELVEKIYLAIDIAGQVCDTKIRKKLSGKEIDLIDSLINGQEGILRNVALLNETVRDSL